MARYGVVAWVTLSLLSHGLTRVPDAHGAESAAHGEESEEEVSEEQDVYVVGQIADRLQRIPGSVQVVGPDQVRRIRPSDTGEILRSVPGVHIAPEEGLGLRLNVGLRGLSPKRSLLVQVLEDGTPVALNPYGEPDLYYSTPVDRVHAVQVLKGSGSLMYGPRVIGGVVNFITVPVPSQQHWVAEGEVGQFGHRKVLARYGDRFGDARYIVQAVHREGDGFRTIPFRTDDVLAKVAFQLSERAQATFKLGIYDETSESPYLGLTQPMYDADPRQANAAYKDQFDVRRYDATLHHRVDFDLDTLLETRVYAYQTSRVWRRQDYDREANPERAYDRVAGDPGISGGAIYFRNSGTIRDRFYDVAGIEPRFEHRFHTGPIVHTVVLGARFHGETARARQYVTDFPSSDAGALRADERHRTLAFATYLQDRVALLPELLVTPGLRIEHGQSRRELLRAVNEGEARDVSAEGTSGFSAFLPGVGVVLGVPSAHAFAGAHAGFAPPRVTQSVSSGGQDAQLDPEKSVQIETGTRVKPSRWSAFEGAVFYTKFYNQIILDTPAGGIQSELVNGGQTRHHGAELAGLADLGKALRIEPSLLARMSYTHTRATFLGGAFSGNLLPYSPMHSATASFDIDLPWGPMSRLAWTYVGDQYTDEPNSEAPTDARGLNGKIPAYHVLDAAAGYRHAPTGLSATLTVKNALDRVYIANRLPDGIQPGGFRQVMASLRWEH